MTRRPHTPGACRVCHGWGYVTEPDGYGTIRTVDCWHGCPAPEPSGLSEADRFAAKYGNPGDMIAGTDEPLSKLEC